MCHATSSATNPYVEITISVNGLHGHGKHADDVIPAPAGGCPTTTASSTTGGATGLLGGVLGVVLKPTAPKPGTTGVVSSATKPKAKTKSSRKTRVKASKKIAVKSSTKRPVKTSHQSAVRGAHLAANRTLRTSPGSRGVLGTVTHTVAHGNLPFTGLPLWPVLLAALGLTAGGLAVRRTAAARN
jgi:hypothetical protein